MKIKWSKPALDDLDQAIRYMSEDTHIPAEHVARQILSAARSLAANPADGRSGRVAGACEWVINGTPFVMSYRTRADALEVLRIVHAMRTW